MSRFSAKDQILDAAESVVAELGAAHLTLDAVAQRAELSKGGLLYHFPSKEALMQSMLTRLCDRFDEKKAAILGVEGQDSRAGLRAFVRTAFDYMRDHQRVSSAILAAGANNPTLLDPIRERRSEELKNLRGGEREVARGLVLMLAVDGLWFNEVLGTMALPAELRQALLVELLELADGGERVAEEGES